MITEAISQLRLILWGGLICLIDLNIGQIRNGTGFRFDILNDTVGAFMITVGVFHLSRFPVHGRYATVMSFVTFVAVLSIFDAIRGHFVAPLPLPVQLVLSVFGIAKIAATIALCVAMRWLCAKENLAVSESSWHNTTVLFLMIHAIPLCLVHLLGIVAIATRKPIHFDAGPIGLLLLPIFVTPIIHMFISTSRMQREADV